MPRHRRNPGRNARRDPLKPLFSRVEAAQEESDVTANSDFAPESDWTKEDEEGFYEDVFVDEDGEDMPPPAPRPALGLGFEAAVARGDNKGVGDEEWDANFAALKLFKARHNHCLFPHKSKYRDSNEIISPPYKLKKQLANWVKNQRWFKKQKKLSPTRMEKLNSIGFVWKPREETWNTKYLELVSYRETHGDCNVPRGYKENPQLGKWVHAQRKLQAKDELPDCRKKLLDEIGFVWSTKRTAWDQRFDELIEYKNENGNCNVPIRYKKNPPLGKWVNTQRTLQAKDELSTSRKERLDEIGFVWSTKRTAWDQRFDELIEYKNENGNCNVPIRYKKNPPLGKWVIKQRSLQAKDELSTSRKERLDEIGFVWNPQDAGWEQRFDELIEFKNEQGNCNVPQRYEKNPQLGRWVNKQRSLQAKDELPDCRKELLDGIEFDWNPQDAGWEQRFDELIEYKNEHGDCKVPHRYKKNPQLGYWVDKQRKLHAKDELSLPRKERLDGIGFVWSTPHAGRWDQRFDELIKYKNEHGNCNVPRGYKKYPQLGQWVVDQRHLQAKGKLKNDRMEKLNSIGFKWSRKRGARSQEVFAV